MQTRKKLWDSTRLEYGWICQVDFRDLPWLVAVYVVQAAILLTIGDRFCTRAGFLTLVVGTALGLLIRTEEDKTLIKIIFNTPTPPPPAVAEESTDQLARAA